MNPSDQQIKEIADQLDCGMRCFFNLKTGEIKTLIKFDEFMDYEEELWEEDAKEIEQDRENLFEFIAMESHESFRIMADFAESIKDSHLRSKLIQTLNKRKPFGNFKWIIDNSGPYRQQWFDYKAGRYQEWVRNQIERNDDIFDPVIPKLEIERTGFILYTINYKACVHFYENILELPVLYKKETLTCFEFGGSYLMVEIDDTSNDTDVSIPVRDRACLRINVEDVERMCKILDHYSIIYDYQEHNWGTIAIFRDPDGNKIELRSAIEHIQDTVKP